MMLNYFPKYITIRSIVLYFTALIIINVLFLKNILPFQFMLFGIVAVVGFFYFSNTLTKKWRKYSEKVFIKNFFIIALVIRLSYVLFSYWYYIYMTGQPFQYHPVDVLMYDEVASDLATRGFAHYEDIMQRWVPSDRGYPTYLGVVYMISGKSILIVRLINTVISAFTCLLIYKLAKSNFGERIGRIAGILSLLMPHFTYYCGLHGKETVMIFLTVAFVERADYLLRSKNYNFFNIIVPILLAGSLFFFRTVLGVTALMAFFLAIVLSSEKKVGWGKRILTGICIIAAVGYFSGGRIATEVETIWEGRSDNQQIRLESRAKTNVFAQYAGKIVFLPMIFTIPFPTMINIENQENQQLMNGSNFVKNITAFFTMLGIFLLFYRKKWKGHILILSFLIGYLAVVALSAFAHSERFHLPSLPFALIIAAYGLSQMDNKKKVYFNVYLIIIFVAIIGWSWFKLAGRGLV